MGYYTGLEQKHNNYQYDIGEPLLGNIKGGYTGVALLPAILLMINEARQSVTIPIPILATGGCMSSDDNMYNNILFAYEYFHLNKINFENIETIKRFSREMRKYINE